MAKVPSNPRLKPIYPAYRVDERVFRIGAQLGITAEFDDPDHQLWLLVTVLDGRPVHDAVRAVQRHFPELTENDILDGIALLDQEGFLEESTPDDESTISARYRANVNYFSRFIGLDGDRFAPQRRINESNILLLGLGGGGSNILTLLAGLGPASITVVDHDVVEEGNLGRQLLYRESDVGRPKALAAADALGQMNSEIGINAHPERITSVEDVAALLAGKDLVISAIDEPPFVAQRIVNKAIVQAGVPCVFAASQVSRGRVYTVIPGKTGCFDCLNVHYTQRDPQFVSQFAAFSELNFDPPSIAYGPSIFLLTATIVDEAMRVLTGYTQPRSLGTQFEVNFEDGSAFAHPSWPRLPDDCPTCGTGDPATWEVFGHYLQQI
ncbi:ThiF family adenylyltransferase [Auritidibacter sp. NML100628]|uniref:ThiF family adenylyltransferase n=1 Tax=Auritidibacter sp. NML100628 TaxID=2170742 RepID=UPI0018F14E25|nr:ThiF family adenylyltransferase [Auritidibacter sp. NML100628]